MKLKGCPFCNAGPDWIYKDYDTLNNLYYVEFVLVWSLGCITAAKDTTKTTTKKAEINI